MTDVDNLKAGLLLDLNLMPYLDHLLLIDMATARVEGSDPERQEFKHAAGSISSIADGYRMLLAAIDRRNPGILTLPPHERPWLQVVEWALEDWRLSYKTSTIISYLRAVRMSVKALLPDFSKQARAFIRDAITRLKTESGGGESEWTGSRFFGVKKSKLPPEYTIALDRLKTATRRNTPDGVVQLLSEGGDDFEGDFLRYWGAQQCAGLSLKDFAPEHLMTAEHVLNYLGKIHHESEPWRDAERLSRLRSAARHIVPKADFNPLTAAIEQLRKKFPPPRPDGARAPRAARSCSIQDIDKNEMTKFNEAMALDAFDFVDLGSERKFGTLAPSTKDTREYTFRSFHSTLIRLAPELRAQPFAERDYPRAVEIFIKDLQRTCCGRTIGTRLLELKYILERSLLPRTFDFIGALADELFVNDPRTGPEIPSLKPEDLRKAGRAIVDETWRRMEDLRQLPPERRYRPLGPLAELYRNGLILVTLSFEPARVADLSKLMSRVAFVWRKTHYVLSYKTGKTGKERFVVFPGDLNGVITRYLDVVRKDIADAHPDIVWVSRRGGALTTSAFQRIVPKMTLEHCGERIYCHLIRRMRATRDVASSDPHKSSRSLGHANEQVTLKNYRRKEADWETAVELLAP